MSTQISEALGWTLIHLLWEGAVVAVALAVVLVLTRSPRVRYAAGCTALAATLAAFVITLIHFWPERGGSTGTVVKQLLPPGLARPDGNVSYGADGDFGTWVAWLAPAWLVGVCSFYLRCAAGWFSVYRMRRRGVWPAPDAWQLSVKRLAMELKVSRPVVLLESLLSEVPVVLGHFRPAILAPVGFLAGLPPEQVEAILLHELAHIRRADYLTNILQRLMEDLLFYHPAVWWMSHVIRVEREHCCDDMVVALRGHAHEYALALTALEQNRIDKQWPAREPALAATGGNLMKRVRRLLYPKGPSGIWAPAMATVMLMAGACMVLAGWHATTKASAVAQQTNQNADSKWQKWLNEDVVYIISAQEKASFQNLATDEEREQFVEQFWARRDPTPGTPENEFKQEHYRRIAYANDHFRGSAPGWKTDRGHIYIVYGPPDEIDSHPSGGPYTRPASEGGATVQTYPFEDWRYAHFAGVGSLDVEFVNTNGEFRMTLDRSEKYKK